MAGLWKPTIGEIDFQGERVVGASCSRAIVFKDYPNALLPWRTVAGNVALSLEVCGVARDKRAAAIDTLPAKMRLRNAQVSKAAFQRDAAAGPDRPLPRATAKDLADGRAVQRPRRDNATDVGIRVNTINPGPIDNKFMRTAEKHMSGRDAGEFFDQMIPLGRHGKPEEIARAVLFLASDSSSDTGGSALMLDGGLCA